MKDTTKKWYQSRMLWLGIATMIGAGVAASANGGTWKEAVIAAIGAAIIFLRADTSKSLTR